MLFHSCADFIKKGVHLLVPKLFLFPLGNTVVCKPSEITSVTAWMLCKIMKDAGLPNGVVNLVFGTGSKAGEALINHKEVNVIRSLVIMY